MTTPSTYQDTLNGEDVTVSIGAKVCQYETTVGWWPRLRQVNALLTPDTTHLLHLRDEDSRMDTWLAGAQGISLAAGIERMTVVHKDVLRDCLVVFPLDRHIYVVELRGWLVEQEWMLFPDAIQSRIDDWVAEGKRFVSLSGGNESHSFVLPNPIEIPVQIDIVAMTYGNASLVMLRAGLVRWRDGTVLLSSFMLCWLAISAIWWWQSLPTSLDAMDRIKASVIAEAPPTRYRAASDMAALTWLATHLDASLWEANGVQQLDYDPMTGTVTIQGSQASFSGPIGKTVAAQSIAPLESDLETYAQQLWSHLASEHWQVTLGEPYPLGSDAIAQSLTITVPSQSQTDEQILSIAFIDLTQRLRQLPVEMHRATCSVNGGRLTQCTLQFGIRRTVALET